MEGSSMKRLVSVVLVLSLAVSVLVLPAPAFAWGHGGFHHGFHHGGCCFLGGSAAGVFTGAVQSGGFAPVYAYPAPVYAYPAPVYVAPPVYTAPPPPTTWYYCRSLGAYYPHVPSCPEAWVPVPAQ